MARRPALIVLVLGVLVVNAPNIVSRVAAEDTNTLEFQVHLTNG